MECVHVQLMEIMVFEDFVINLFDLSYEKLFVFWILALFFDIIGIIVVWVAVIMVMIGTSFVFNIS